MSKVIEIQNHTGEKYYPITVSEAVIVGNNETLAERLANLGQGSSTNSNADTLDGYDSSYFAPKQYVNDLAKALGTGQLIVKKSRETEKVGELTEDDIMDFIISLNDSKVGKVVGKGLSTNDFTNEYKNKLDNINQSGEILIGYIFRNVNDNANNKAPSQRAVSHFVDERTSIFDYNSQNVLAGGI